MVDVEIPQDDDLEEEGGGSASRLVPWLIIVAIALMFVPLYFGASAIEEDTKPLSTELINLQTTLTAPPLVPIAEQTLSVQLLDLRSRLRVIADMPATMVAGHLDWPGIMATLHTYDANQIRLKGFVNEGWLLTLNGEAVQEASVLEYVSKLQKSGFFTQVRVQAITIMAVASPTPNAEPAVNTDIGLTSIDMPFVFTLSIDLARADNGLQ